MKKWGGSVLNYDVTFCCSQIIFLRPVRRIGTEIRSGPVRSSVSDRSRTDLGPDRFDVRKFFRRCKIFENKNLERRNRFRQKIVEIGAILAIFELFEGWKIRVPLLGEFSRSSQDLYRNPLQIEHSPGRLSKFFEKWRVAF